MTRLCTLAELAVTGAKGLTLKDGREILIAESSAGPRAFLNSCPHNGVTLEILPDRFFNEDRTVLVCTAHGARFLPTSGLCVSGPCAGRSLTPISVRLEGDEVHLNV